MANIHGLGDGERAMRNGAFMGQQREQNLNNGQVQPGEYPEFIRHFFV